VEKALIKFTEDASYGGIMWLCSNVKEKKIKPHIPSMVSLSCLVSNGVLALFTPQKEVLLTAGAYDTAMSKGL
jgi:hypothetical protein